VVDWDEQAEDDEIAKLNVILKMAGKAGRVFRNPDGPGYIFRVWWCTGPDTGFEEDELYSDGYTEARRAWPRLARRVHRVATAYMDRHAGLRDEHAIALSDGPPNVKWFARH